MEIQALSLSISVLVTTIVRARVRLISVVANKLDLLSAGSSGTNRLVFSSSPPSEAREDERAEQDTASHTQDDNRNEKILLLSLEVVELLLGIRGGGVTVSQSRAPDVRCLDTLGREKFGTIGIDNTDRVVTCGANTVDEGVRDDVVGVIRGLGETDVTKIVLLDGGGAVTQPTSDERLQGREWQDQPCSQ